MKMKEYLIVYREQGQMGWDKRKTIPYKAGNMQEAKDAFEIMTAKPTLYKRTLLKIYELVYEP